MSNLRLKSFYFSFERVAKTGRPGNDDKFIEGIFEKWAVMCDNYYLKTGELPFSYNERASVSTLIAAASKLDIPATIESPIIKKYKHDRRQNSYGYADLHLYDSESEKWAAVEVKQYFKTPACWGSNYSNNICKPLDDVCAHKGGADIYYGMSFFCITVPIAEDVDHDVITTKFSQIKRYIHDARPHFMASIELKSPTQDIWADSRNIECYWPGAIVSILKW